MIQPHDKKYATFYALSAAHTLLHRAIMGYQLSRWSWLPWSKSWRGYVTLGHASNYIYREFCKESDRVLTGLKTDEVHG